MLSFSAEPLEKFSTLHTISLLNVLGIKSKFSFPRIVIVVNFNLQTPLQQNPQALLTFHLRDSDESPISENPDFCINNLTRWRLNISRYDTFMGYLQKMKCRHYKRFIETQKTFVKYGAKISLIEEDWSPYAEAVYNLYIKVAEKHGTQLYDLNFFCSIAKLKHYKLMCAWYGGSLIGALVIIDEEPIFHSMCCGLDYEHSKKSHTYSQMHYEFIRLAIEAKKYTIADIGPTANETKAMLDFQPVTACMDVYAHNRIIKCFLRFISLFTTATINSQAQLKLNFHLPGGKRVKGKV